MKYIVDSNIVSELTKKSSEPLCYYMARKQQR